MPDRRKAEAAAIDRAVAAAPPSYVRMTGRIIAWSRRLELAYCDGDGEAVQALFAVITGMDDHGGPDMPRPMGRWNTARQHALSGLMRLIEVCQKAATIPTIAQIADGAASLVRRCGPAEFADDVQQHAVEVRSGHRPLTPRPGERSQQFDVVLACAASGWLLGQLFPAREAARLFMEREIREAEQLALRAPTAEWGGEATDEEAIRLLAEVLGWDERRLPARDPRRRHLLDLDLIAVAKQHLEDHPDLDGQQRDQLRRRLDALITTFTTTHPAPEPAVASPVTPDAPAATAQGDDDPHAAVKHLIGVLAARLLYPYLHLAMEVKEFGGYQAVATDPRLRADWQITRHRDNFAAYLSATHELYRALAVGRMFADAAGWIAQSGYQPDLDAWFTGARASLPLMVPADLLPAALGLLDLDGLRDEADRISEVTRLENIRAAAADDEMPFPAEYRIFDLDLDDPRGTLWLIRARQAPTAAMLHAAAALVAWIHDAPGAVADPLAVSEDIVHRISDLDGDPAGNRSRSRPSGPAPVALSPEQIAARRRAERALRQGKKKRR